MYTMVVLAALTTAIDMPDRGGRRRGGGCCGCYGGGYGMGMGYGGGWGGCYGGMGMGYGGGWGGCYGMGMGYGGMGYGGRGMGWGGYGYGGYTLGSIAPMMGSYAYSPTITNGGWGNSLASGGTVLNSGTNQLLNQGGTQSFYFSGENTGNEATIVVHLPAQANLTIDGEQTQQRSGTRTFTSPPLEPGKVYTYTLRAEMDRNGNTVRDTKTIEVRAGQRSEVTIKLEKANREGEVRAPASQSSPRRLLTR